MVNRRTFVTAAAGATGSLLGARTLGAATQVEPPVSRVVSEFLHFDDPVEEFRAQMRMERDLVEEQGTTLTWYHWLVFVIPGGRRPEPLIRYEGYRIQLFPPSGRLQLPHPRAQHVSLPRDLHTNEFTDSVINPITGELVEVPVTPLLTDPGTIGSPVGFRNLAGDGFIQQALSQVPDRERPDQEGHGSQRSAGLAGHAHREFLQLG